MKGFTWQPQRTLSTNSWSALLLLLLAATFGSCSQPANITITGALVGSKGDTIYLEAAAPQGKRIIDSTISDNKGEFSLRLTPADQNPSFYNLLVKGHQIPLLLSPGERVELSSIGNWGLNYEVSGSPDSELIRSFRQRFSTSTATLDSISARYTSILPTPQNEAERAALIRTYTEQFIADKRASITFVIENANSLAALYALYQRMPNNEPLFNFATDWTYYRLVADSLEQHYPSSGHLRSLQRDLTQLEEANALAQRINQEVEQSKNYPEIELNDMFGKPQKLSAFDGKAIVIDFWIPSANSSTNLLNSEYKELYESYHDKGLEIYQVALTDNRAAWINRIQSQRLPWTQVIDLNGPQGMTSMSYAITGVPANVVISPEGEIVARNLFGEELSTRIGQLLR